jgi:hypothetical protein
VLALEDADSQRAVIITSDLPAIRRPLYLSCLPRLKARFGFDPAQVLLAASHTHRGPMLPNGPHSLSAFDPQQRERIEQYANNLADEVVESTGRALAGPVEHSVPVLAVREPDGKLAAVLFGHACRNTTLTRDFYQYCGDYAAFAQTELERSRPGVAALFFIGCTGDQGPVFRGGLSLAERYGNMLAAAVEECLLKPAIPLAPHLTTAMESIPLKFGPAPAEAELLKLQNDQTSYVRRWTTNLLEDVSQSKQVAGSV